MAQVLDDIRTYLPKYLSVEATKNLFDELSQFPNNIDSRLYTGNLDPNLLYQGDGVPALPFYDHLHKKCGDKRGIIVSNTCDIAPDNEGPTGLRLMYCPIVGFEGYKRLVGDSKVLSAQQLDGHMDAIRQQRSSSHFFLPANSTLGEDAIALFDWIASCPEGPVDLNVLKKTRLFSFSDYGFYLFLFKLSIHLTRIREGVERSASKKA